MELKERMIEDTLAILAELQSGILDNNKTVKVIQQNKLRMLYNYIGDDIDEEYWKQIEDAIYYL